MKIYEEYTIPAKSGKRLAKRICELCGHEDTKDGWDTTTYEINDTRIDITVMQEEGESHGSEGYTSRLVVDICPTCFKEKLIPWLKEQGATLNHEELDW